MGPPLSDRVPSRGTRDREKKEADKARIIAEMDRVGHAVLPNMLDEATRQQLVAALRQDLEEASESKDVIGGGLKAAIEAGKKRAAGPEKGSSERAGRRGRQRAEPRTVQRPAGGG